MGLDLDTIERNAMRGKSAKPPDGSDALSGLLFVLFWGLPILALPVVLVLGVVYVAISALN